MFIVFSSSVSLNADDKPWKKHNKKNKREKLRRVYAHLDEWAIVYQILKIQFDGYSCRSHHEWMAVTTWISRIIDSEALDVRISLRNLAVIHRCHCQGHRCWTSKNTENMRIQIDSIRVNCRFTIDTSSHIWNAPIVASSWLSWISKLTMWTGVVWLSLPSRP